MGLLDWLLFERKEALFFWFGGFYWLSVFAWDVLGSASFRMDESPDFVDLVVAVPYDQVVVHHAVGL